jgi:hypothetical protein
MKNKSSLDKSSGFGGIKNFAILCTEVYICMYVVVQCADVRVHVQKKKSATLACILQAPRNYFESGWARTLKPSNLINVTGESIIFDNIFDRNFF